jgi:hypothetical protein
MPKGENRLYVVMDENGKITRLIEAESKAKVRDFLLRQFTIDVPANLTVSRLKDEGMKTEVAE